MSGAMVLLFLRLAEGGSVKPLAAASPGVALAEAGSPAGENPSVAPQNVDIEAIRQRYWASGAETEIGVVQDRLFSKSGKIELGAQAGVLSNDPFLSIREAGVSLGVHLTEIWSLRAQLRKHWVSPSAALRTFEEFRGATVNTNPPRGYAGLEGAASLLYGKLSLLGLAVIYYDLHGAAGAGVMMTESGNSLSPLAGVGQRFFLSRAFSLRIDYRAQFHRETIVEKAIPTKLGQPVGARATWSHGIFVGIDFLWEVFR